MSVDGLVDISKTVRDELRAKYPAKAKSALTERKPAVELFCGECMGGRTREAAKCETSDCFLWPHGFGRGK